MKILTKRQSLKRLLCLFFALLNSFSFAQNTYIEALARYWEINNGGQDIENSRIRNSLIQYTNGLVERNELPISDTLSVEKLVQQYFDEQFFSDWIAAFVPYFQRAGVTSSELNELTEMLESEEGRQAVKHKKIADSEENLVEINAIVQHDLIALLSGKKKIDKKKVNVSKQRKALFSQYYQNSQSKQIRNSVMKVVCDFYKTDKKKQKLVKEYFDKNMELLMLEASSVLSDKDLKFFIHYCKKPQYKKIISAIGINSNEAVSIGYEIMDKYEEWLRIR